VAWRRTSPQRSALIANPRSFGRAGLEPISGQDVLEAVGGFLVVLDEHRPVLAANREFLSGLGFDPVTG